METTDTTTWVSASSGRRLKPLTRRKRRGKTSSRESRDSGKAAALRNEGVRVRGARSSDLPGISRLVFAKVLFGPQPIKTSHCVAAGIEPGSACLRQERRNFPWTTQRGAEFYDDLKKKKPKRLGKLLWH